MNHEIQVIELIREGNPIPDPERLTVDQSDNAVYLAALQRRNSEMMPLEEEPGEKGRRPTPTWVAAAVAIIVLGVALLLMSQGGEETPLATEPTPTTAVDTTPTTVPASTTTIDPAEAAWQAITVPVFGMEGGGRFRAGSFFVPFSYEVPDGWTRDMEDPTVLALHCGPSPDPDLACIGGIIFFDPEAETVDEALESLRSWPGPTFGEPVPVQIGGASGFTFEVTSEVDTSVFDSSVGARRIDIGGLGSMRGYVLDVAGTIVAIYVDGTIGDISEPDEADYYARLAERIFVVAQPVLDSIVWKDLN